jgi:hypothetical protein
MVVSWRTKWYDVLYRVSPGPRLKLILLSSREWERPSKRLRSSLLTGKYPCKPTCVLIVS